MPRYDFQCPAGHTTEHTFLFSEVPEKVECPAPEQVATGHGNVEVVACGAEALRTLSTNFSFIVNKAMNPPSKRKRGTGGS